MIRYLWCGFNFAEPLQTSGVLLWSGLFIGAIDRLLGISNVIGKSAYWSWWTKDSDIARRPCLVEGICGGHRRHSWVLHSSFSVTEAAWRRVVSLNQRSEIDEAGLRSLTVDFLKALCWERRTTDVFPASTSKTEKNQFIVGCSKKCQLYRYNLNLRIPLLYIKRGTFKCSNSFLSNVN